MVKTYVMNFKQFYELDNKLVYEQVLTIPVNQLRAQAATTGAPRTSGVQGNHPLSALSLLLLGSPLSMSSGISAGKYIVKESLRLIE